MSWKGIFFPHLNVYAAEFSEAVIMALDPGQTDLLGGSEVRLRVVTPIWYDVLVEALCGTSKRSTTKFGIF